MREPNRSELPVLPPVAQPSGANYWLGTISGRLMLINSLVFLAMSWESNSVLLPSREVLLEFGAKDPVGLARGEFWRLFTPIFVHIGIIHFFFNSLGLFYIGYQLERILGRKWFTAIYLAAGVAGNISSAYFSVAMSAGASGALFGLLGSGYVLERLVGRRIEESSGHRPRRRIYAGMVVINVIFGLLVPGIDNAAHMGGLVAGAVLTWSMLHLRRNRLTHSRRLFGIFGISGFLGLSVYGIVASSNGQRTVQRFERAAAEARSVSEGLYYIEEALRIFPGDLHLLIEKVRFVLMSNDPSAALEDIKFLLNDDRGISELRRLRADFLRDGLTTQARFLDMFLDDGRRSI